MKAKLASCVLVLGALAAAPVAVYADKGDAPSSKESMKEHVSDAWITTKIKSEFAKDKSVSAMKIHVDTDKGVVKLTGKARSQQEADAAVALAQKTKGVVSVQNDMQIGATTASSK